MKPTLLLQMAFTTRYNGLASEIVTDVMLAVPKVYKDLNHDPVAIKAIWDTGATNSSITRRIAQKLNLPPIGKVEVIGIHEKKVVDVYYVDIYLPNHVIISMIPVSEAADLGPGDYDLLIGMDIIRLGDFAITNANNRTTISFRMPPYREIDFIPEVEEYNMKMQGLNRAQRRKFKKKKKKR